MQNDYNKKINEHYAKHNLFNSIVTALTEAGLDKNRISRADIANFEEFHIGGRDATRHLADFVQLEQGSKVLDVGCGIGGPARTLADEYDCDVIGVDLTDEFIQTAKSLTELVGLSDKVSFQVENATELSFDSNSFDIVWMQHVNMNIENKDKLFSEAYRVLKPLGQLILYEILQLNDEPLTYPVHWAGTQELSYLVNEDSFREKLENVGLIEVQWEDRTLFALSSFEKLASLKKNEESNNLNLSRIVNGSMTEKIQNMLQNLKDQKICVVQAAYSKRA